MILWNLKIIPIFYSFFSACGFADEDTETEDERANILGASAAAAIPTNVNVYTDEDVLSPSKEKNNAVLADLYSRKSTALKPDVNLVINNTFEPDGYVVDEGQQQRGEDDEEDMDPKTLVVNVHHQ
jgi:hypothetical protein